MIRAHRALTALAVTVAAGLALTACGSSDPLAGPSADDDAIVVGSQSYPSNEIIAEIYAQALEGAGVKVERKFDIGQRDAYMPAIEKGEIQLFPEYSGNLLQYLDEDASATASDDVYAALKKALPSSLTVLDKATATDQDSYTVTDAFAKTWGLSTIADLKKVTDPLVLGGNPELADRPYGPKGLKKFYGVDIDFTATGDTTVEDLLAGTVNVADVYTSDPRIQTKNLTVLEDTEGMLLASNVVPLVTKDAVRRVADVINAVQAKLTPDALVSMNVQNTVDQKSAADVAAQFLADNDLS